MAPTIASSAAAFTDTADFLLHRLRKCNARRVLDIGCGDGGICATLARQGFQMTGIDPSPAALAAAGARGLTADFILGRAEALPPGLGPFDAALFVNALHHVAPEAMQDALRAALSCLAPEGVLIVVEPLPTGSFFRVLRPIEDETEARKAATRAVEALLAAHLAIVCDVSRWTRESRFGGFGDFIARLEQVDPARGEAIRRKTAAVSRDWRDNIQMQEGMAVLHQPMICWTLARA